MTEKIVKFFLLAKQYFFQVWAKLIAWKRSVQQSAAYRFFVDRMTQYGYLCRLNKPIGIFLLLWPTLSALWIAAEGRPDWLVLSVFILGTVLMRSAGCAINDFADRKVDMHVKRTQHRPIVQGTVSPKEAVFVFLSLSLLAFGLVLLMNRLTIYLSCAAVVLAAAYPFAKRHTYMPQVVLGTAFACSVPMAFAAQTGTVPTIAWLLFVVTILWTTAYDTMYAMVDREDDIEVGVKSTAILFGELDVAIIVFLQVLVVLALFLLGQQLKLSVWYILGLLSAALLFVYQFFLIRHRQPEKCFKAFLNNSCVGLVVFLGLVMHYAMAV